MTSAASRCEDAVAQLRELLVPTLIERDATMAPKAVNFHDDTHGRCEEVYDVPIKRHLTVKCDPKPAAA
jgi:hypothetical protein